MAMSFRGLTLDPEALGERLELEEDVSGTARRDHLEAPQPLSTLEIEDVDPARKRPLAVLDPKPVFAPARAPQERKSDKEPVRVERVFADAPTPAQD